MCRPTVPAPGAMDTAVGDDPPIVSEDAPRRGVRSGLPRDAPRERVYHSALRGSATMPAVSLPELRRIRELLSQRSLFLVVQDCFMTETAELADVVLSAATERCRERAERQMRWARGMLKTLSPQTLAT